MEMHGCVVFLLFVGVIAALVVALQAKWRAQEALEDVASLRAENAREEAARSRRHRENRAAPPPPPDIEVSAPRPPAPPPNVEPVTPPTPAAPPPAPPPRDIEPPAPPPPTPPPPSFDWESLVGVRLFSWIGGIAFVLAAIFFIRYSVEHGWLRPAVRAALGLLGGSGLLLLCELRVARDYKVTANALYGAGIAILYATLFAMNAVWHLVPTATAFLLMAIVTAVAVLLSIRRDSIFVALLGLLGGFATPGMLWTGENHPITLFGYLLLLNLGLAWVAYRKRWPILTALSVALSAIYQWVWVASFLTPSQLPLAFGIFITFAMAAATALWARRSNADLWQPLFDRVAIIGAALPLLFAVFAAAVPAYGAHYHLLFAFLLLVASGLAIIAATRGHDWLHVTGGAATVIVFTV